MTTIHNSHCSKYFCANIHMATMLAAVVKASPNGIGLSVRVFSIPDFDNAAPK